MREGRRGREGGEGREGEWRERGRSFILRKAKVLTIRVGFFANLTQRNADKQRSS